jgi:hypothetical protein
MKVASIKMDRRQIALLNRQAKAVGCSQVAIVRDLIDRHLGKKRRPSLHERAKDLCGSLRGSKDLSTCPLTGYGRD